LVVTAAAALLVLVGVIILISWLALAPADDGVAVGRGGAADGVAKTTYF